MEILTVAMEYESDVLYAKGHVDLGEFLAAAGVYADASDEGLPPTAARYAWLRYNPDPSMTYAYIVTDGTPGKQARFRQR